MNRKKTSLRVCRSDGRTIGSFNPRTGVFTRHIHGERHILRKPTPSLCIDESILRELIQRGCRDIEIGDVENGTTYRVSITNFLANAFEIDYGYGLQLALPLGFWSTTSRKAEQSLTLRQVITPKQKSLASRVEAEQIMLFE